MTENSAITAYFKRIGGVPLLTGEQEKALFERIGKGDAKARDELIERNLKLVIPTAKQYMRCGIPFADFIQEGSMAVAHACDKFDASLGHKFSTYATYWIKQRIGRYVKKHFKNVFVPEYVVNLAVQVNKAKRTLAQDGITEPSASEITERLHRDFKRRATEKEVKEAVRFCQGETSMSAKVGEDGDTEFGGLLEDQSAPDPAASVDREAARSGIESALAGLTGFERNLIGLRYGVGVAKSTVAEISAKFGETAEGVMKAAKAGLRSLGAGPSEIDSLVAA